MSKQPDRGNKLRARANEIAEGASFWKNRRVNDIFIAAIDGLTDFKDAIRSVFPQVEIQRCVVHQIRNSLKYVTWSDRQPFAADLKGIYQASICAEGELKLLELAEKWGDKYAMAVRSRENNWQNLATFFDYTPAIRRLIYTTNPIEGDNRQLRKVTKTKSVFSLYEAVRKLLWLAHRDIVKKWTIPNWALILN